MRSGIDAAKKCEIQFRQGKIRSAAIRLFTAAAAVGIAASCMLIVNGAYAFGRSVPYSAKQEVRSQPPDVNRPENSPDSQKAILDRHSGNIFVASPEDYRIGPSDVLEIKIEDAPELSGTFPVSAVGTFVMPFLGTLTATDKTPEELREVITQGLIKGEYLKRPRVAVTVTQYNSRSFYIQGAVRGPGVYGVKGRASLLKLIILAGGLADNHGTTAFIIRPVANTAAASGEPAPIKTISSDEQSRDGGEKYDLIKVNISGLMLGNFEQNISLEAGDIVNIPPTNVFYVAGEVGAPGSFPLKEGTTLRQAISLARGTTFRAAAGNAVIFRDDPKTGERKDIRVDIGAIMSGKKPDIPILANDVIIVPNSKLKSIGGALLSAFGISTVNRGVPIR